MFHTIILVGNLGKDPEMKYTPSGQPVTNFSVASNRSYNDANGQPVKETIWFRVTAWGKQAETINQYCQKGKAIFIEGAIPRGDFHDEAYPDERLRCNCKEKFGNRVAAKTKSMFVIFLAKSSEMLWMVGKYVLVGVAIGEFLTTVLTGIVASVQESIVPTPLSTHVIVGLIWMAIGVTASGRGVMAFTAYSTARPVTYPGQVGANVSITTLKSYLTKTATGGYVRR